MGRIDRDTWCSSHGCVTSRLHVDVERIGIFRPSAYNLVISTFVFEHLSHPEQGFASIVKAMAPSGWLFLAAPFFQQNHGQPWDFHRYTYHALYVYARDHLLCVHQVGGHGHVNENTYTISKLVAQKAPCEQSAEVLKADPSLAKLTDNGYALLT